MIIYLDMDGVIADFFKAFATRNGVDHWKSIKQKEFALTDLVGTDSESGCRIMASCLKLKIVSSQATSISMP